MKSTLSHHYQNSTEFSKTARVLSQTLPSPFSQPRMANHGDHDASFWSNFHILRLSSEGIQHVQSALIRSHITKSSKMWQMQSRIDYFLFLLISQPRLIPKDYLLRLKDNLSKSSTLLSMSLIPWLTTKLREFTSMVALRIVDKGWRRYILSYSPHLAIVLTCNCTALRVLPLLSLMLPSPKLGHWQT